MQPIIIIGLILLLAAYILFTSFYLKRKRGIKRSTRSIFHEDKNRYGIVMQGIIFVGFVFALIYIYLEMEVSELSLVVRVSPFAGLFILQTFFTGFEEFLLHRQEKRYWYEWSESLLILSAFILLFFVGG